MLVGLFLAIFVFYRKRRDYAHTKFESSEEREAQIAASLEMTKKEWAVLGGAVVAFGVQIYTESMPLGALLGLLVMIVLGGIEYRKIDKIMDSGLAMMGFIAFIMLVAAGFGSVLRESGGIEQLVGFASEVVGGKIGGDTDASYRLARYYGYRHELWHDTDHRGDLRAVFAIAGIFSGGHYLASWYRGGSGRCGQSR